MNSNTNDIRMEQAEILEPTEQNLRLCAESIKSGEVVGFPTETVYGLGANALNIVAVKKIFEYKGRPLSDPLIVHVTSIDMGKKLIDIDDETHQLFKLLSEKFWPGPLTMVLKANFNIISPILTANTEYIGIRYPKNDIAKKLIDYSEVPIAAPSANKFCHISPVNPFHVYEDFVEFPVKILNGGVSSFRMESTVLKIIHEERKVQILRMGAISPFEIETFLNENNLAYSVEICKKINKNHTMINELNSNSLDEEIKISQESPGQFLKHYSPKLDTFIYDEEEKNKIIYAKDLNYNEIVFLDYNKILYNKCSKLSSDEYFLHLSASNNPEEVMLNLYDFLHKSEKFETAKFIILCDIKKHMHENPHKETLVDRITKAAADRKLKIIF